MFERRHPCTETNANALLKSAEYWDEQASAAWEAGEAGASRHLKSKAVGARTNADRVRPGLPEDPEIGERLNRDE